MSYNYFEQQEQWLQERCGKFTASEIYKLMQKGRGKDQYFGQAALTYIRNKTAEILTQEPVGFKLDGLAAVEWGNSKELEAVMLFEQQTGLKVEYFGKANPKFFEFSTLSGGSPDGLVKSKNAILEVKAPYNSGEHFDHLIFNDADDLKEGKPEYYWQIQANMLFTGKFLAYFVSYDPRYPIPAHQLKILEVVINDSDILEIKERIAEAEKQVKLNLNLVKDLPVVLAQYDTETKTTIIQ